MSSVIQVKDLSKKFIISHEGQERYTTLRDTMAKNAKKVLAVAKSSTVKRKSYKEEFYALKDVSFTIEQGDRVGIIGRNGAGKSTLLKILSRITEPTSGEIKIRGRVASLLEVGTGFHPELTGRENIFLNGAILGMSRSEIRKKFDEIVDFAEVEKFLDTPVKRYSSGMYVRLAFAVAAYLEPEILVVDEVLSVGDAEFQKKCLGKMGEVSQADGRTVLFVSHNIASIKQLCNRGILLQQGKMIFNGSATDTVQNYQNSNRSNAFFEHTGPIEKAPGNEYIRILEFIVKPLKGATISISSGFSFELKFYNHKPDTNIDVTFEMRNGEEIVVFHHGAFVTTNNNSKRGVYLIKGTIPSHLINAGIYRFSLIFAEHQRYAIYSINDFIQFEIMNEVLGSNPNILPGILKPDIPYDISFEGSPNLIQQINY